MKMAIRKNISNMSLCWFLLWFKPLRTHLLRTIEEVRKIEMHNLPARNKTIRDLTLAMANMADIDMIRKNSKVRKATTSQGTISWLFRAATPDIKNLWIRGLYQEWVLGVLKVFFFQKVRFGFLDLRISKKIYTPKNYPELEI